jgi:hypothetical protein
VNRLARQDREVRGTVRTESGDPLEGVLVIGLDLGYGETAADGSFRVRNPEMALTFWCTGYYPQSCLLGGRDQFEVTLRAVKGKAQAASR